MLKISISDLGEESPLTIVENDRANWESLPYVGESGCFHLEGFGGEDVISIHVMPMQDSTCSVVVVYASCDSVIRVQQGRAQRWVAGDDNYYAPMTALINDMLAKLCDYPEEL